MSAVAPPDAAAPDTGALPFTALAPSGSAQAVAIGSAAQDVRLAANTSSSDSPSLLLLYTLAIMAIPLLLTMTLLAVVLTRR